MCWFVWHCQQKVREKPSARAEEGGVRGGRRQNAENFDDFRVRIYAPALLWFESRDTKWREVLAEGGRKSKKSREIRVLHEGPRGVRIHYIRESV